MAKGVLISQAANFAGQFGLVLRSSAIFYYRYGPDFSTTIHFMNYWKYKRGLDVAVVASLRSMDGKLLHREQLRFDHGEVVNYSPRTEADSFEGSLEIEVFSIENLVIPYAAIVAVYESPQSTCVVHTYARVYSPHEIEEKRTISHGEESCWTIRDSGSVRSFCVIHNGPEIQPQQTGELVVRKADGETRSARFKIQELPPYSTIRVFPSEHLPDLSEFLNGEEANCSISFTVNNAFTRLLVGNEKQGGSDFQVTHSNFNYSRHRTDTVDEGGYAVMELPVGTIPGMRVVVYPDTSPGAYELAMNGTTQEFRSGDLLFVKPSSNSLKFKRRDGALPSRIVTGIIGENPGHLPFECSVGVLHKKRPTKRMWWGPVAMSERYSSRLFALDYPTIYGEVGSNEVCIRLFSQFSHEYRETTLRGEAITALRNGVPLEELFPDGKDFLGGQFGHFTFFSEYGGFFVLSSVQNEAGVMTLEHSF